MQPLPTPEEMARADAAAIEGGTSAALLMDRAGRAVARAVVELAGGRYGTKVAVVCGKGNNGGDGFVAARVLHSQGVAVSCMSSSPPRDFSGPSAEHLARMREEGVALRPFAAEDLDPVDVVVDAVFGTGFEGLPRDDAARIIEAINSSGALVVAVDIPSGVDGLTGATEGVAVRADVTVAMGAQKLGTTLGQGALHSDRVEVAEIGIDVNTSATRMLEARDVLDMLPIRALDAHKRSSGAVAVIAGSEGMSGAALLTARGAERMGSGYVTVASTRAVDAAVSAALPEVLTRVVTQEEALGPESLDAFSDVLDKADAVALGPGLGQGVKQRALVAEALTKIDLPIVLDADGLNSLASDAASLEHRSGATVITPHPAELARLMNSSTAEVQADRAGSARGAADRFGCVVLLKGFRSVIAHEAGLTVIPTGGPELATAGTGDVLTGVVAALLAAGLGAREAAEAGAFVHGLAGSVAGANLGATGVVAWDVAEALPEAIDLVWETPN